MEVREQVLGRHDGEILICGDMPIIQGDRARLTLLFQHLADNALKFNRHSVPCVEISCQDNGMEYRLDFVDNGIGVPSADSERILELFSKLNDDDEFEGSGTVLTLRDECSRPSGTHLRFASRGREPDFPCFSQRRGAG